MTPAAQPTTTTAEIAEAIRSARSHLLGQGLAQEGDYVDDDGAICLLEALACGVADTVGGFYGDTYGDTFGLLAMREQPDAEDRRAQALLVGVRCAVGGTIGVGQCQHVWSDAQCGDTAAVVDVLDRTRARLTRA